MDYPAGQCQCSPLGRWTHSVGTTPFGELLSPARCAEGACVGIDEFSTYTDLAETESGGTHEAHTSTQPAYSTAVSQHSLMCGYGTFVRAPSFSRLFGTFPLCWGWQGVLPDIKTYNAALSVVARSGREDVALALLNQMRIDGETQ